MAPQHNTSIPRVMVICTNARFLPEMTMNQRYPTFSATYSPNPNAWCAENDQGLSSQPSKQTQRHSQMPCFAPVYPIQAGWCRFVSICRTRLYSSRTLFNIHARQGERPLTATKLSARPLPYPQLMSHHLSLVSLVRSKSPSFHSSHRHSRHTNQCTRPQQVTIEPYIYPLQLIHLNVVHLRNTPA